MRLVGDSLVSPRCPSIRKHGVEATEEEVFHWSSGVVAQALDSGLVDPEIIQLPMADLVDLGAAPRQNQNVQLTIRELDSFDAVQDDGGGDGGRHGYLPTALINLTLR